MNNKLTVQNWKLWSIPEIPWTGGTGDLSVYKGKPLPERKIKVSQLFAKKNYSTTSDLLITNVKILSLEILKKSVQYILINIFCSLVC